MHTYNKTLTVPKGLGDVIGMTLRRSCIKESVSVRPIGFLLEDGGNMVHSKDHIVEDMISVCTNLAKSQFSTTSHDELIIVQCDFVKQINLSDISKTGQVTLLSEDRRLLTSLNNNVIKFSIAFRNTSGNFSNAENKLFLQDKVSNSSRYVMTSSRHTAIEAFSYTVKSTDEEDILDINYTVNNDDQEVLNKTISRLANIFNNLA